MLEQAGFSGAIVEEARLTFDDVCLGHSCACAAAASHSARCVLSLKRLDPAALSRPCKGGHTPLLCAAGRGDAGAATALLAAGAAFEGPELDVALAKGHVGVVAALAPRVDVAEGDRTAFKRRCFEAAVRSGDAATLAYFATERKHQSGQRRRRGCGSI